VRVPRPRREKKLGSLIAFKSGIINRPAFLRVEEKIDSDFIEGQ